MKLIKMITILLGAILLHSQAHAANLLVCARQSNFFTDNLVVSETATGYAYTLSRTQSGVLVHLGTDEIEREISPQFEPAPLMLFQNENIRIIHLFGEYYFEDQENHIKVHFPDQGCRLETGNDFVETGLFQGFCAYPGYVRREAEERAAQKCAPAKALSIGKFHITCTPQGLAGAMLFRCQK